MAEYRTVVGYFPSRATAESAISALKQAGFRRDQIGVATSSAQTGKSSSPEASNAQETGKSGGGAWESLKNFFRGNAAEPYAGEATKETFNDGVVASDRYSSEDVPASLADLSIPTEDARYFSDRLAEGAEGALVTVTAPGSEEEASQIITANGGNLGRERVNYDDGRQARTPQDAQNIELYGEVLRVHKDRVNRGEVRLRKEVTTSTQSVEVPVKREEIVVERVPVPGERVSGKASFEGEEIRIPLSEERASVDKQAVVREEIRVGKKEVTNVERFDEKVRNEELKVDQKTEKIDRSA